MTTGTAPAQLEYVTTAGAELVEAQSAQVLVFVTTAGLLEVVLHDSQPAEVVDLTTGLVLVELHCCHSALVVEVFFAGSDEVVDHWLHSAALVVVVGFAEEAVVLDHCCQSVLTAEAEAAATRPAATNDFIFGFEGWSRKSDLGK